jgi:anti-anti-sigma factor
MCIKAHAALMADFRSLRIGACLPYRLHFKLLQRWLMKLSLVAIEKAGYVRLSAEGEITSRDFLESGGTNPIETVLGNAWAANNILLSMERTIFIDSSAIGWLIDSQRKSKAAGGKLVLHSAPARVRDVFDLLKMRSILNLKDDERAACDSLTANAETK